MTSTDTEITRLHLTRELGACLSARGWQVATAESCTGGMIGAAITEVPGSSAWFEMGWLTYSNQAKVQLLGVAQAALDEHGAVSQTVVEQMALGARQRSGAELAVAVSGIAGPDGGSRDKPVGTVWLAWAGPGDKLVSECYVYQGERQQVRAQACITALRELINLCKH
ncbi:CinA family protein [Gilvimarinus sp. DA14]|uniref:CinA family protein n=1 Tax=Gilvimarinus sp. DA14 TaxID=2956798 RepID=UPI0020B762A0|nr:CinA family protein [Gilvimarinus sp. DA14]UTF60149.1 CinA family protein [Gilvimarinus sp. DA14]